MFNFNWGLISVLMLKDSVHQTMSHAEESGGLGLQGPPDRRAWAGNLLSVLTSHNFMV